MIRSVTTRQPYYRRSPGALGGITDTLSSWKASAEQWIAANPVDVFYAALAVGGLAVLAAFTGGGRRR
jgi:hypothetical protein